MSRIAVLGAGAWGTALALAFARRSDHAVTLWAHAPAHRAALSADCENRRYLPGMLLPASLVVAGDLAEALAAAEIVVSVVPSEHTRAHFSAVAPLLRAGQTIVSATKGLEDRSYLRMTEVIHAAIAKRGLRLPVGVLSGPSFAQEVAAGLPTAVTVAFAVENDAARVQGLLTAPGLRLYRNTDVVGVELGGALKNVMALAAGAVAGSGLGSNATAALITRGIAEMTRLALACGGRRETLAGLAGVGDLVLTCTGALSRNRLVGFELGRGRALEEVLAGLSGKVAEGVKTTGAALRLAEAHGVEMPIAAQVAAVLAGERSPVEAMRELMGRAAVEE